MISLGVMQGNRLSGCGLVASPPHHTPNLPELRKSYTFLHRTANYF
jgi:hypothetical protein